MKLTIKGNCQRTGEIIVATRYVANMIEEGYTSEIEGWITWDLEE